MPEPGRTKTDPAVAGLVFKIAARVLATYFIPGFVGRGVRLGSESLSAANATVVASENLEVWKSGNQGTLKSKEIQKL